MIEGIYHVTFSSNSADFGEGIVVFKGGSVNGGDYGYLYVGRKTEGDGRFIAKINIKQWNPTAESIFGPLKEFILELTGTLSGGNNFTAEGYVVGQPGATIAVRGSYLSAAA